MNSRSKKLKQWLEYSKHLNGRNFRSVQILPKGLLPGNQGGWTIQDRGPRDAVSHRVRDAQDLHIRVDRELRCWTFEEGGAVAEPHPVTGPPKAAQWSGAPRALRYILMLSRHKGGDMFAAPMENSVTQPWYHRSFKWVCTYDPALHTYLSKCCIGIGRIVSKQSRSRPVGPLAFKKFTKVFLQPRNLLN